MWLMHKHRGKHCRLSSCVIYAALGLKGSLSVSLKKEAPPRSCLKWQHTAEKRLFRLTSSLLRPDVSCFHPVTEYLCAKHEPSKHPSESRSTVTSSTAGASRPKPPVCMLERPLRFLLFPSRWTAQEMRGLLPLCRGLGTLTNRQATRKAGAVGSWCGFCGAQSKTKVLFGLFTCSA